MAALFVASAIGLPAALHVFFGVPKADTALWHTEWFLRGYQTADSWQPMEAARAHLESGSTVPLYQEVFFRQQTKFQYPPSSLLFVDHFSRETLNLASRAAVLVTVVLSALLFSRAVHDTGASALRAAGRFDALVRLVIVFGMGLTFYPLVKAYSLGQIQTWLTAAFALMLWTSVKSMHATSGVLLGLMCLIKPPWALLLVWGVLTRRWKLVSAASAVVLVGVTYSVWQFGVAHHLDYLTVVEFIGARGEAFYANQSVTGALNRWFENGDSMEWHFGQFPPPHAAVQAGSIVAFILLVGGSWIVSLRGAAPGNNVNDVNRVNGVDSVMTMSVVSLAAAIASPIAWEHHYGILWPVLAIITPRVLIERPLGRASLPLLIAAYVTSSHYWPQTNLLAGTLLNPLQSYLLCAGLITVGLLLSMALRRRRRDCRAINALSAHPA